MQNLEIGFLGFGLIGGSIAKVLSREPNIYIKVYTRRQNNDLEKGVEDGVIDELVYSIDHAFASCDIIFLCAPVLTNISFLKTLKKIIKPNCIITDVGSVKGNIHDAAARLGMEENFIGGHPMAGSEKTGYASSSPMLLENAYYFLTPTKYTKPEDLNRMKYLVAKIGAVCIILDAQSHDNITAAISHVPHIIAASLVNLIRQNDDEEENMKNFAAGGFKDITRIASSSPEMWQNICLSNAENIKHFLMDFCDLLYDFNEMLTNKDETGLKETFRSAGDYRDSVPSKKSSVLARCFEVFVDIADETGAIAAIATILAEQDISIKNIGIIHNREFADGVLRIELYHENAAGDTVKCLQSHGYSVCKRE